MSLRTRLVLALVCLATASVAAVGAFSYVATRDRLHAEIDASIDAYVDRFSDPDLRSVDQACRDAGIGLPPQRGTPDPGAGELPQALITCVAPNGAVLATNLADRSGSAPRTPIVLTGIDHAITQDLDGRPARVVAIRVGDGRVIRVGRSLDETNRVLESLRNRTLVVGLLVVLGAAAVGWLIARRTARPVAELTRAAESVTSSGSFDTPLPPPGDDEVGRLARAFAAMLDRLRRSSDLQQQLVQDAGHELRTPLTSLRANIDTLCRHPEVSGERRAALLADLDGETRELSSLVDELVALAGDSDPSDLEPERVVRLDELARRVAERTARRAGRHIEVSTRPTRALGRPGQLERAIGNLLENAVKFSPPPSPVELEVAPGRLAVRDHGPGFAEADLPHVFDRFYRAVDARDRPGSGLGLSIVRDVAERSGGDVGAANHPDGGALVTLRLPEVGDGGPPAADDLLT